MIIFASVNNYEAAKVIIDNAVKAGVNYFDTAYIYHGGESEVFLGKALKDYPRDSYYVADKFNYQANTDYREQFAQQLERLQMDWVDFYLLHGVQDYFVSEILDCGCISYFDQMKKEVDLRRFHAYDAVYSHKTGRKVITYVIYSGGITKVKSELEPV